LISRNPRQGSTAHHIENNGASYFNIYVYRYPILKDTAILVSVQKYS
jgi:hypothetical protein